MGFLVHARYLILSVGIVRKKIRRWTNSASSILIITYWIKQSPSPLLDRYQLNLYWAYYRVRT